MVGIDCALRNKKVFVNITVWSIRETHMDGPILPHCSTREASVKWDRICQQSTRYRSRSLLETSEFAARLKNSCRYVSVDHVRSHARQRPSQATTDERDLRNPV